MAEGQLDAAAVERVLDAELMDPETGRSVSHMNQVHNVRIEHNVVTFTLALTTHMAPLWNETKLSAEKLLLERFPSLQSVVVELAIHDRPPQKLGQIGLTSKSLIAVGSGKGGVGKSTLAASLAIGLKRAGCKVGCLMLTFMDRVFHIYWDSRALRNKRKTK